MSLVRGGICLSTYSRFTGQNAAIGGFSLISTNGHRVLIPDQCGSYPLSPLPCPAPVCSTTWDCQSLSATGVSPSRMQAGFLWPSPSWCCTGAEVLCCIVLDTQSGRVRPSSASALIAQSHSQTLRHVPRMNWFLHG